MPPDKIEEFCKEILEAGRHLASVSSACFTDAERVSEAIEKSAQCCQGFQAGWMVGHLPREQHRRGVCND